jgi:hypothetical protein
LQPKSSGNPSTPHDSVPGTVFPDRAEEEPQDADTIRDIDLAVVGRIGGFEAARRIGPLEKEHEVAYRVGNIHFPIRVGVAADEAERADVADEC